MAGDPPPLPLGELPYRRNVEKIQNDRSEFDICKVNERVISRFPFQKKYLYVHLKEQNDGEPYWNILLFSNGEPKNFVLGKDSDD